jgi:hypothetical protein
MWHTALTQTLKIANPDDGNLCKSIISAKESLRLLLPFDEGEEGAAQQDGRQTTCVCITIFMYWTGPMLSEPPAAGFRGKYVDAKALDETLTFWRQFRHISPSNFEN